MSENTELTYVERAGAMNRAAKEQLLESAGNRHLRCQQHIIDILNEMRAAGREINQCTRHEQLIFTAEGTEWCRREILPHLKGASIDWVKQSVKLARREEPVHSIEEAFLVWKEVQMSLGLEVAPRRIGPGEAHVRNLFSDFFSAAKTQRVLFEKLVESNGPPAQWDEDARESFLRDWKWLDDKYEEVKKAQDEVEVMDL